MSEIPNKKCKKKKKKKRRESSAFSAFVCYVYTNT